MTHAKSTVLLASMLTLLAACSNTALAPNEPGTNTNAALAAGTTAAASARTAGAATPQGTAPAASIASVNLPPYLDPANRLSTERSVFFAFDDYTIAGDYTGLVERHGRFLAANPGVAVRIEGNSDERGGVEYNLALGQKRADAVLRALSIHGVRDNQMEAVSWGEAKPRAEGHDESAWAQDRRADLQYPRK